MCLAAERSRCRRARAYRCLPPAAWSLASPRFSLETRSGPDRVMELVGRLSGVQHGPHNALVSRTAADVARQRFSHYVLGEWLLGIGVAQQLDRGDKESRRAESALQAVSLGECAAQPGCLLELIQSFYGVDPQPVGLDGQRQAGARTSPLDEHRAGTTDSVLT